MNIIQITPFFLPRKKFDKKDKKKYEFFGGAENLIYNLSKALIEKNHIVNIYTINYLDNKLEKTNYNGINITYFPKIKFWKAAISFQLLSFIIKDKKSIFHGIHVGHPLIFLTAIICKIFKKPFYCTHVGTRKFLLFSILTSKIAEKIIIPTKFSAKFFKSFGSSNKIIVIPHGIDVFTFNPHKKNNIIRGNIVEKKDFVILFVGRLRWHKGVDYLIRSFKIVNKYIENVHLCIVGEGEERKRLENMTVLHGLNDKIHFLGYVESNKLPSIYAESNVFVLPSITSDDRGNKYPETEAFGIVLLEAMASGIPVIATKVGGVKHVIDDGYTGFLIKEKDYKKLATKIMYLIKNNKIRNKMSMNAIKKTRYFYNWNLIINKYIKLFSLLKN